MSTNARSATKMIPQPIGIKILKRYGPTIGRGAKSQSASRRSQKLRGHGEPRTPAGHWLTPALQGQCVEVNLFSIPVAVVEQKKQSLITRITTNLLKLSGFVSRAISNGTKN
jgi:hypothetical protein